ncbi:EutN/CcmL family microcompartment protein [Bacillus thermotolerans]|uniref:Ethanolamine utilization polyhedral-body-like protein EutN n=1 Tax=Bacillus thermotolerans TaxID=1221996 RepID=A0A0F5HMC5_BACTR|nr:EutN/CcmL family microcompartment protein [Bacillus thermotolerans]KKB34514.1 Ethanolamine utilization polyhedral-body-like protein EutN [Bacillus thermotolerans]KKB37827.1 Ethanolamine utilization polyhedral-body-like protein EutN [Bacillus thermotolerans]KKB41372.1 Ethanolamine utilization polyhedral-body-like protein EutN [Bacillus thermotolerans]
MYVGVVVGSVVATTKEDDLVGKKLLIVQKVHPSKGTAVDNRMEVAVDNVGAGTGEHVLVTTGGAARNVFGSSVSVIDAAIVAIVDSMEVNEQGSEA